MKIRIIKEGTNRVLKEYEREEVESISGKIDTKFASLRINNKYQMRLQYSDAPDPVGLNDMGMIKWDENTITTLADSLAYSFTKGATAGNPTGDVGMFNQLQLAKGLEDGMTAGTIKVISYAGPLN